MKKLLSFLLAAAMILCLVPTVALAEDEAPRFTVTPDKTVLRPGDTVTFNIESNIQTQLYWFQVALCYEALSNNANDGSKYLEFLSGELIADNMQVFSDGQGFSNGYVRRDVNGASGVLYINTKAKWGDKNSGFLAVPPSQVCKMTFRVKDGISGTVTTPVGLVSWTRAPGDTRDVFQDQGDISLTIIGSPVQAEGDYSVSLGQPAPVSVNETVQVPVNIGSEKTAITSYNVYDMTFSYDAAKLSPILSGFSDDIRVTQPIENTIRVQRYGAAKNLGEAFALNFTALAAGTAEVTLADARVDIKANATDFDAQAAAIPAEPTAITIHSATTHAVSWSGSGLADVPVKPDTAYDAEDFTFTVNKAAGYAYTVAATMGGAAATVTEDPEGIYTVASVTGDLTITVEKTLSGTVAVSQYMELEGRSLYLVTVTGDPGSGNVYEYDGNAMYEAANYGTGVYSYLVIVDTDETAPDADAAKALVTVASGSAAGTVPAGCDVNASGTADINDAQLCYDLYRKQYSDFTRVSMEKFLRADVNQDKTLDSFDAVAVVNSLREG